MALLRGLALGLALELLGLRGGLRVEAEHLVVHGVDLLELDLVVLLPQVFCVNFVPSMKSSLVRPYWLGREK